MTIRYVYAPISLNNPIIGDKQLYRKDYALIKIKDINTGKMEISPFSDFIITYWGNWEFNTQKKVANNIVPFLNFVAIDHADDYGLNTIYDIDFSIGEDFLNDLSRKNIKKKTIKRYEDDLVKFYRYLAEKGLLTKVKESDFKQKIISTKNGIKIITLSPFINVFYPKERNSAPIKHDLPAELVLLFIETAIRYQPRIALGIYFQIFGGVRRGEVTSLTRSSINPIGVFGVDGFILDIQKRDLRSDLIRVDTKGHPKRLRFQPVLSIGTLGRDIYKDHLRQFRQKNGDALFLNNNGMAMTAKEYSRRFNIVKKKFIEELSKSKNPYLMLYAQRLKEYKWSTHISRGIFSNMIAKHAKSIQTVALFRGDRDYSSALTYLSDVEEFAKSLEEVLAKLYEEAKHGNI